MSETCVDENHNLINQSEINQSDVEYAKINQSDVDYAKINQSHVDYAKLNQSHVDYAKINQSHVGYAKINQSHINNTYINHHIVNHEKVETLTNQITVNHNTTSFGIVDQPEVNPTTVNTKVVNQKDNLSSRVYANTINYGNTNIVNLVNSKPINDTLVNQHKICYNNNFNNNKSTSPGKHLTPMDIIEKCIGSVKAGVSTLTFAKLCAFLNGHF